MPTIAVHFTKDLHPDSYSHKWIEALQERGISVKKVNCHATDALLQIKGCDGLMWHWFHTAEDKQIAPKLTSAVELGLQIPVFPNLSTAWHYDEKTAQNYLLQAIDAPIVPTWVFWNKEESLAFLSTASFPLVFKLSVGAGSSHVVKVDTVGEARQWVDKMFDTGVFPYRTELARKDTFGSSLYRFLRTMKRALQGREFIDSGSYHLLQKGYTYFQKFIPGNGHDIRISVIGHRAFGYIRKNRKDDFRASGSGNFDVSPVNIPIEAVRIAHEISTRMGFQTMAYDFLLDESANPIINEISYGFVNWMVHRCPGYWDRNLAWHTGHVWPENAHVEDFLKRIQA